VRTLFGIALSLAIASAAPAAGQRLSVDLDQSRIEVQVHATMDSFTARLTAFEPAIVYDPERAQILSASLGFRFQDVNTGNIKRDRQMHEWQQTAEYPLARFELINIESVEPSGLRARGALTLHGITRELEFAVVVTGNHDQLSIDGEAPLDTRHFGLKVIRKFGLLKVSPEVVVHFHLQGRLEPSNRGTHEGSQ